MEVFPLGPPQYPTRAATSTPPTCYLSPRRGGRCPSLPNDSQDTRATEIFCSCSRPSSEASICCHHPSCAEQAVFHLNPQPISSCEWRNQFPSSRPLCRSLRTAF